MCLLLNKKQTHRAYTKIHQDEDGGRGVISFRMGGGGLRAEEWNYIHVHVRHLAHCHNI